MVQAQGFYRVSWKGSWGLGPEASGLSETGGSLCLILQTLNHSRPLPNGICNTIFPGSLSQQVHPFFCCSKHGTKRVIRVLLADVEYILSHIAVHLVGPT